MKKWKKHFLFFFWLKFDYISAQKSVGKRSSAFHLKEQLWVHWNFSVRHFLSDFVPLWLDLTYVEWCLRTTMAFQSFLSCIAVCTSDVSSPVSCFRTSTYVRGCLPGFLLPCFGIQWISLDTGSFLFLKQWNAKHPLLSLTFCESFGRSP